MTFGVRGGLSGLVRQRSVLIIPKSPRGLLDSWTLDCCERMTVRFPGETTSHPIEDAEDITDHEHHFPEEFSASGFLTDTPIGYLGGGTRQGLVPTRPGIVPDRAIKSFEKLLEIRARREPVVIVVSMIVLPDMAVLEVELMRDANTGAGIEVAITCGKRRIVKTATVPSEFDFDAKALGAGGTADAGTQSTFPPPYRAPVKVPG